MNSLYLKSLYLRDKHNDLIDKIEDRLLAKYKTKLPWKTRSWIARIAIEDGLESLVGESDKYIDWLVERDSNGPIKDNPFLVKRGVKCKYT